MKAGTGKDQFILTNWRLFSVFPLCCYRRCLGGVWEYAEGGVFAGGECQKCSVGIKEGRGGGEGRGSEQEI